MTALSPENRAIFLRVMPADHFGAVEGADLDALMTFARQTPRPWTREASDQVRDLHESNNALLERARRAEAENKQLRANLDRTAHVAARLAAELEDPGCEAFAAIYCARELVPHQPPRATRRPDDPMEAIVHDALADAGWDFLLDGENPAHLDFYLPDIDVHLEVKRFHTARVAEQMGRVENVIVAQGAGAVAFLAALLRHARP